ncbi:MAG TPA: c-type cytochrome biogenesis protein CcsB [Actinobacteria bacterium]|nr:c-type cytochrome biogenesis protein CcsB [Actinomycetota bacterium]
MTQESAAALSNQFVYAAMFVYTLSMLALAWDLAVSGVRGRARATEVLVGAGAPVAPDAESTTVADDSATEQNRTKSGGIGLALLISGAGLQAIGVLLRAVAAGRVPWGNMYEFTLTASLAVVVVYLVLSRRLDLRWMALFIVVPVLLSLGLAVTVLYVEAGQLVPALRSYWLAIHVTAAVIAFGIFTTSAIVSVLYLLKERAESRGTTSTTGFLARIPSVQSLDTLGYRLVAFVFPLWTFAVIAGAIWAESAWGRYWGWDPKETWAFITWVIYAGYLHARVTIGWRGRRSATIALVGYAALMFNFVGVNLWIPGLHSYSGLS